MLEIKRRFDLAAAKYNAGLAHGPECKALIISALEKLCTESEYKVFGDFRGQPNIAYFAFFSYAEISRPVRPDLFIYDPAVFSERYTELFQSFSRRPSDWAARDIQLANAVIYTGVMAVACCYDLWQKSSRKTPGTFFEILMAAILQEMLPYENFSKHIPLTNLLNDASVQGEDEVLAAVEEDGTSSVSTDLVIQSRYSNRGLVVPLKITTRERIVQPFAHQRILDSAFGVGAYTSLVVCISETQQDKRRSRVNHICVPGTVKLFQRYLAPVGGLYYCDVPPRYQAFDMQSTLPVKSVGEFFIDVYAFFERQSSSI